MYSIPSKSGFGKQNRHGHRTAHVFLPRKNEKLASMETALRCKWTFSLSLEFKRFKRFNQCFSRCTPAVPVSSTRTPTDPTHGDPNNNPWRGGAWLVCIGKMTLRCTPYLVNKTSNYGYEVCTKYIICGPRRRSEPRH